MALTCEELIDEVKSIVGRPTDTELITDTRVTRWLNEAQRCIAERVPGIKNLVFKNTTSLDTTQSLVYNLYDVSVCDPTTDNNIAHLYQITYLDGNESCELIFTHVDVFDSEYPDPTHSDVPFNKPFRWTQRNADEIEVVPLCSCAYVDNDLRFDGDRYAVDMTVNSSSASELDDADDGLILYAIAKAWAAIGDEGRSQIYMLKFSNPNPDSEQLIGWLEKYKDQNDTLHEWNGNVYSDGLQD